MGASESTGRLNGTEREEEEERRQESGGGSTGAALVEIAAGAAAVWGISRMLSDDTDTEIKDEEERRRESGGGSTGAAVVAIAAGAAAVWGISRMLSDNTDTEKKDEARTTRDRTHGMEPSLANQRIRSYTGYTDEGSNINGHVDRTLYFGSGSVPDQYATPEAKSTTKTIWFPPPPGRFKMNTDGGFRPTEGRYSGQFGGTLQNDADKRRPSAYAGILRNHRGKFIDAFRGFIVVTDSLEAEIIGIHKGLERLVKLRKKGAILESDCDQAVLWIKGENKSYQIPKGKMAHCKDIIEKCRKLADENSITIDNIDRSANKCADELACLALKEQNQYVQFDLPDKVKKLVDEDKTAYSSWLKSGALLLLSDG